MKKKEKYQDKRKEKKERVKKK